MLSVEILIYTFIYSYRVACKVEHKHVNFCTKVAICNRLRLKHQLSTSRNKLQLHASYMCSVEFLLTKLL